MYFRRFSDQRPHPLGLVLAIGLVVDERNPSCSRTSMPRSRRGCAPGRRRRGVARSLLRIISTTIALVAVFMPLVFLQGLTGRLFREFGVVIGGSVLISAFCGAHPDADALVAAPATARSPLLALSPDRAVLRRDGRRIRAAPHRVPPPPLGRRRHPHRRCRAGLAFPGADCRASWPDRGSKPIPHHRHRARGHLVRRMDRFMDAVVDLVRQEVPEADQVLANTSGFAGGANTGNCTVTLVDPRGGGGRSRRSPRISPGRSGDSPTHARSSPRSNRSASAAAGRRFGLPIQYVVQAPTLAKLEAVLPRFLEAASEQPESAQSI